MAFEKLRPRSVKLEDGKIEDCYGDGQPGYGLEGWQRKDSRVKQMVSFPVFFPANWLEYRQRYVQSLSDLDGYVEILEDNLVHMEGFLPEVEDAAQVISQAMAWGPVPEKNELESLSERLAEMFKSSKMVEAVTLEEWRQEHYVCMALFCLQGIIEAYYPSPMVNVGTEFVRGLEPKDGSRVLRALNMTGEQAQIPQKLEKKGMGDLTPHLESLLDLPVQRMWEKLMFRPQAWIPIAVCLGGKTYRGQGFESVVEFLVNYTAENCQDQSEPLLWEAIDLSRSYLRGRMKEKKLYSTHKAIEDLLDSLTFEADLLATKANSLGDLCDSKKDAGALMMRDNFYQRAADFDQRIRWLKVAKNLLRVVGCANNLANDEEVRGYFACIQLGVVPEQCTYVRRSEFMTWVMEISKEFCIPPTHKQLALMRQLLPRAPHYLAPA